MSAFYSSQFLHPTRLDTSPVRIFSRPPTELDFGTPTDTETESSFFSVSPLTRNPTPLPDRDVEEWSLHSSESDLSPESTPVESPVVARSPANSSSQLQPDRSPVAFPAVEGHLQATPTQELPSHTSHDPMIPPGVYKIVNYKSGTVLGILPGELTKVTCSPENDAASVNRWLVTPLGSGALIRASHDHLFQSASDYLGPGKDGGGIRDRTPLGLTAFPLVWTISQALFPPAGQQRRLPDEGVLAVIGWPHGNLVLDLDDYGKAERGTGVSFQWQRSHFEPCQYWCFIRCDEVPRQQSAQIGWPVPTIPGQARDVVSWAKNIPPQGSGEPPRTIRRKVIEEETTEDSWEGGTGVVRTILKTTTTTVTETSMVTL